MPESVKRVPRMYEGIGEKEVISMVKINETRNKMAVLPLICELVLFN